MTRTRWIIFAIICVLVLSSLVFFSNRNRVDVSSIDQNQIYTEGPIPDRVLGNRDSDVIFIEYGDFQCPGCQSLSAPLKQIVDNYTDQMAFVFRNFPLTASHPNAIAAATAAEAAGQQEQFFEMHDLLFQNQTAWANANAENRTNIFRSYAEQLGLNLEAFDAALSNPEISEKIQRDQALARKAGATSTPTVVLNGETLDNSLWSNGTDGLEQRLREAIRASGQEDLPQPINAIEQ